jgi:predicted dehydrogenase
MNKLKVGIVGCGHVSEMIHIPAFLRLKKTVTLSAVCDLNRTLARDVAQRFNIRNFYSNLSEMISEEALDVVDVCTPPKVHAPVALEAMERGCNVLLEKPMAPSLDDCDKMIESSKKHDIQLSVIHNQNFYPPFMKARKIVESGALGKLIGMRILSLTPQTEYIAHENHWIHKLPGGAIGETGPHAVYMSLAFLNNVQNVEVNARKQTDYPWVSYDSYQIDLIGKNLSSSVFISHAGNSNVCEVELVGTKGTINIDLQSMLLIHHNRKNLRPTGIAFSSLSVVGQTITGIASNIYRVCLGKSIRGHDIMIKKYIESIRNNHPVPVTPDEGRETIRVMQTIVNKLTFNQH